MLYGFFVLFFGMGRVRFEVECEETKAMRSGQRGRLVSKHSGTGHPGQRLVLRLGGVLKKKSFFVKTPRTRV
jgi:hypothetical protein